MSSKLFPVSEPWSAEVQRQFIHQAYEYYKAQHGDPRTPYQPAYYRYQDEPVPAIAPGHQKRLDTIQYLYNLGRGGKYLKISYKEFEAAIFNGGPLNVCQRHHRYRYCGCGRTDYDHWYPRNGAHYRCKVPINYKAKEPDPEAEAEKQKKKEWRDKKGFQRTRNQDKNWRRGVGARSYQRTLSNRAMRRWEKKTISNEKWEDFADQKAQLKLWLDPWSWD